MKITKDVTPTKPEFSGKTYSTEMTIPSTSFILTASRRGGEVRIKHRGREKDEPFLIGRDKITELINLLTHYKDEAGPELDEHEDPGA